MLKNEVTDTKTEEAPPQQESKPEVVGLVTERIKPTRISKETKRQIDNKFVKNNNYNKGFF